MITGLRLIATALLLVTMPSARAAVQVGATDLPPDARPLPIHIAGRALASAEAGGTAYRRQWPGTTFETAFRGRDAYFLLGEGEVRLNVLVDGQPAASGMRVRPGSYRVSGLAPGDHRLRVEIVSESQAGATIFGGFRAAPGTAARPLPQRMRQIEFIGDSHTVGYGNTSATRTCSEDEVWATTDTTQGLPGQLGRRYGADIQVNAISGRGVVRNYGGFAADPLPAAYPYTLLDHAFPYRVPGQWHPQVIVIALGTNDFTTPLHPGEQWADRAALHADFEATYVGFVRALRARNPRALILLWATDMADGEIEAEVRKVADRLRVAGERRLAYVPVNGLTFGGCNSHPTVADDRLIAARLAAAIDQHTDVWPPR